MIAVRSCPCDHQITDDRFIVGLWIALINPSRTQFIRLSAFIQAQRSSLAEIYCTIPPHFYCIDALCICCRGVAWGDRGNASPSLQEAPENSNG